jgi:hypothetical protein
MVSFLGFGNEMKTEQAASLPAECWVVRIEAGGGEQERI